jgi:hypothetical protein
MFCSLLKGPRVNIGIISGSEWQDFPKTTSVLTVGIRIITIECDPKILKSEMSTLYKMFTLSVNLFVYGRQVSVQKFNQLPLFTQLFHRLLDVKKLRTLVSKTTVQCVTIPPSYSPATFTFILHDKEPPLCLPSSSELHCPAIKCSYSWRPSDRVTA